jgi:hypothetical protein
VLAALKEGTETGSGPRLPFVERLKGYLLAYGLLERLGKTAGALFEQFAAARQQQQEQREEQQQEPQEPQDSPMMLDDAGRQQQQKQGQPGQGEQAAAAGGTAFDFVSDSPTEQLVAAPAAGTAGDGAAPDQQQQQQQQEQGAEALLWHLTTCLEVIENASFSCLDNERHLVQMVSSAACRPFPCPHSGCLLRPPLFLWCCVCRLLARSLACGRLPACSDSVGRLAAWAAQVVGGGQVEGGAGGAGLGFLALLLGQLGGPVLRAYLGGSQQAGHCLRVVAAVLVNLTHQNEAGGCLRCCGCPAALLPPQRPAAAAAPELQGPLGRQRWPATATGWQLLQVPGLLPPRAQAQQAPQPVIPTASQQPSAPSPLHRLPTRPLSPLPLLLPQATWR